MTEVVTERARSGWRSWVSGVIEDLKGEPQGRAFRFSLMVLLPLAVVGVLTVLTRLTGFDLSAQQAIYLAGKNSWSMGEHPFWMFLYRSGGVLALSIFGASVVGYILSWYRPAMRGWRKLFLFNMLLLVVAPGLISNGILKEYWGRPRPREVEGMGGHNVFEPVLTYDASSDGKSFPCGHATMGFYLLGGYFLMRRHRKDLATAALAGGIVAGSLIGIARMARGGHFFSDVVWAFAVCYFVALGLYYLLGLHKGVCRVPEREPRKMPLRVKLALGLLSAAVIVAALLATPYRGLRDYFLIEEFSKDVPLELHMTLTVGDHELKPGDEFRIRGEAYGHGVPTSRIAELFIEQDAGEFSRIVYHERLSGWLSEVNEYLEVSIHWDRMVRLFLHTGETKLNVALGESTSVSTIRVVDGMGDVVIRLHGQSLHLTSGDDFPISGVEKLDTAEPGEGAFLLEVGADFAGTLTILD